MSDCIGINGDQATLLAPVTPAAIQQLLTSRPKHIELIGDWSDLTPLSAIAGDVKQLTIAGDLERGRIKDVVGLIQFTSLSRLRLASVVKGGYDLNCLQNLEELEAVWQAETATAFTHPKLQRLTLKSFPDSDIIAIQVATQSVLARLWLATTKLEGLEGIDRISNLKDLRITDAKKLRSLAGMSLPKLQSLDIENASSLSDVSAIADSPVLQTLRLNSISPTTDLSMLSSISTLRQLQVGGRSAPTIDWLGLMRLPLLLKVFAWWDPNGVSEGSLREAAEIAGRQVMRFEPMTGRGCRPLLVELA